MNKIYDNRFGSVGFGLFNRISIPYGLSNAEI